MATRDVSSRVVGTHTLGRRVGTHTLGRRVGTHTLGDKRMWKAIETYRVHNNEQYKKKYEENKARGTCAYCGKHPPLAPFVSCATCRRKHRHYNRLWSNRQREMRRQGLVKDPTHAAE